MYDLILVNDGSLKAKKNKKNVQSILYFTLSNQIELVISVILKYSILHLLIYHKGTPNISLRTKN